MIILFESSLRFIYQQVISLVGETGAFVLAFDLRRILMSAVDRIGFSAQVREHVMAATCGALVSKRVDVYGRDDDALAGARARLCEDAPVEVYDLTAARP